METHLNGLTEEQQKRSSLISCLDDLQTKLILSGVLGILDTYLSRDKVMFTKREVAQELLDEVDTMIEKAYEKGMYS